MALVLKVLIGYAREMKQTRLSMKLLWELRGDFCLMESGSRTNSQIDAMEYTRRFLGFVDGALRTPPATQHSKKRVKNPLASQKHNK